MYIEVIGKDMQYFCNRPVVLFGAGSCGQHALEEFEKVGAKVIGFCDNNRSLIGKEVMKYPVLAPEQLKDLKDTSIVVTSTYEEEIKKQLQQMQLTKIYFARVGVLKKTKERERFQNRVVTTQEANQIISNGLQGDAPFFTGRLGSVELECLSHYIYFLERNKGNLEDYPQNVKYMMHMNAGFFPSEEQYLDEFCKQYLQDISNMDLIWSMWFSEYEDRIYHDFVPEHPVAEYDATCLPIKLDQPWVQQLQGKKVLVIHPFKESIEQNYKKRDFIYPDGFLPEFELKTLKAVQSIAGNKTNYKDWFEALNDMKNQMREIDFDVALIGAGAYGLPLAAYAKDLGKKALHIGGILQLFFGIKGKAWDYLNIYNEHWTSPAPEETPNNFKKVEAGRYW